MVREVLGERRLATRTKKAVIRGSRDRTEPGGTPRDFGDARGLVTRKRLTNGDTQTTPGKYRTAKREEEYGKPVADTRRNGSNLRVLARIEEANVRV
jgi:hypothetical protein